MLLIMIEKDNILVEGVIESLQVICCEKVKMSKNSKKTVMVIALISIVLCGCPGLALLFSGASALLDTLANIDFYGSVPDAIGAGLLNGGYVICLAGLLIPIPIVLLIIALIKRSGQKELEKLEPTGISKDDPLPPTS